METQELILKVVKKMLKILRLNCYNDKIKSFFDISCDNNREWRPMWTKKKNYMPKHLEPHFIQTMAVIVTEAGKIPVSLEAKSTDVMGIMRQYLQHIIKIQWRIHTYEVVGTKEICRFLNKDKVTTQSTNKSQVISSSSCSEKWLQPLQKTKK